MNTKLGFDEFERLSGVATRAEIDRRKETGARLYEQLSKAAKRFKQDADHGRFLLDDYKAWNELEDEYEDMVWKAYVYAIRDIVRLDEFDVMVRQSHFSGHFMASMMKAYEKSMPPGFVERFLEGAKNAYGEDAHYTKTTTLNTETAVADERIMRIASDEAHYINNYVEHDDALMGGATTHIWTTVGDDKVRPIHMLADGQRKPIGKPFLVGGELLMFPGDASLGATPGNLINCRCWESFE